MAQPHSALCPARTNFGPKFRRSTPKLPCVLQDPLRVNVSLARSLLRCVSRAGAPTPSTKRVSFISSLESLDYCQSHDTNRARMIMLLLSVTSCPVGRSFTSRACSRLSVIFGDTMCPGKAESSAWAMSPLLRAYRRANHHRSRTHGTCTFPSDSRSRDLASALGTYARPTALQLTAAEERCGVPASLACVLTSVPLAAEWSRADVRERGQWTSRRSVSGVGVTPQRVRRLLPLHPPCRNPPHPSARPSTFRRSRP